jgi:hypothetical protein
MERNNTGYICRDLLVPALILFGAVWNEEWCTAEAVGIFPLIMKKIFLLGRNLWQLLSLLRIKRESQVDPNAIPSRASQVDPNAMSLPHHNWRTW